MGTKNRGILMILKRLQTFLREMVTRLSLSLKSKPLEKKKDNSRLYAFEVWAYGDDIWNKYLVFDRDSIDLMNSWNQRHGDKLILKENDLITVMRNKMLEIYKEEMHGMHTQTT